MSDKKKIDILREKNNELAKDAPYNFCDRWCQRCPGEIQRSCALYLDEVGRKAFNIAHGRDEDDEEVLKEDLEIMTQAIEENMAEDEEFVIDEDEMIDDEDQADQELEDIKEKVQGHNVVWAIDQYSLKAQEFLSQVGFFKEGQTFTPQETYHLDTISWYLALLPSKINRAMIEFYEADAEVFVQYSCYDSIAQLDVCRKSVRQSIEAFKALKLLIPKVLSITSLLAMLNNIEDQIDLIEQDIAERIDK